MEPTRNVFLKGMFSILKDKFFLGVIAILALVFWAGWDSEDISTTLRELGGTIKEVTPEF